MADNVRSVDRILDLMEILAEELGESIEDVSKRGKGSEITIGRIKE